MKFALRGYSRNPLGRLCKAASELLDSTGLLTEQELLLMSRSDRRDLSREEIFASARDSHNDRLEIKGKEGSITLGWLYGPRATTFSQSIVGSIELAAEATEDLAAGFFRLSRELGVFFAVCDLQSCFRADADLWSRQGDITTKLVRPYWLNFFGIEYQGQVPIDILRQLGVRAESGDDGTMEVQFPIGNTGVDASLRQVAQSAWPVFIAAGSAAHLSKPIAVDMSAVQELRPPPSQEDDIAGILGDLVSFLGSVPERRDRGLAWARERGLSISQPRDVLLAARRFEAQVRDSRELLVDLIATYGEMIREAGNGRWSIGKAVYRGEPIVRLGPLGLKATPVAREFLEAFSGP